MKINNLFFIDSYEDVVNNSMKIESYLPFVLLMFSF